MATEGPLLGANAPATQYLEAYRALRAAVLRVQRESGLASVLVTSAGPGEGKTTVVVNLGTVLALAEKNVLLVDADFRRPQLHAIYDVPLEPGFTDLCLEGGAVEDAVRKTGVKGLWVMAAGGHAEQGPDIAGTVKATQLLGDLRRRYDFVLLDSAPVNLFAGAVQVAAVVDGVLYVVRSRSYAGPVQRGLRALEAAGANVIGVVLNDVLAVDREAVPQYYGYDYRRREEEA